MQKRAALNRMNHSSSFPPILRLALVSSGLLVSPALQAADSQRPPNVIVVFTDDHGYADLGVLGVVSDLKTPHLDRMAREGAIFTDGYVTAPICGPSRVGLISGRYQQRFGMETHSDFPLKMGDHRPIPARLKDQGYVTGMTGKLHLPLAGQGEKPALWGFDEYWKKAGSFREEPNRYFMTHDREGKLLAGGPKWEDLDDLYRVDASNQFAVQFIERNHEKPFFLYVAQFAPHVPLEATEKYLSRFSEDMPPARRYALAMIAAIDDGVGMIRETLEKYGIEDNTIIFFAGDNGAPLEEGGTSDLPIDQLKRWDGSLNTPLLGEKGMLMEGGIRVPFLAWGPRYVKPNQRITTPVTTLDFGATAVAASGGDASGLDGESLLSLLAGEDPGRLQNRPLFWRFGGMDAVRIGNWKLLRTFADDRDGDYLFDLSTVQPEQKNLIGQNPEMAAELAADLDAWTASLDKKGLIRDRQLNLNHKFLKLHAPK
jgi:arylsulfatase A-like enzyme